MNAGGVFATGAYGGLPIVRDLKRSEGLLYRQTTACRRLIQRTSWLTGAVLSRYHRTLLPPELPRWSDIPLARREPIHPTPSLSIWGRSSSPSESFEILSVGRRADSA
jgi:hypothetical protein